MQPADENYAILMVGQRKTTNLSLTLSADPVRITLETALTGANCPVILGRAFCIGAASESRARVLAAFLDACEVKGTVRVSRAFWSWS